MAGVGLARFVPAVAILGLVYLAANVVRRVTTARAAEITPEQPARPRDGMGTGWCWTRQAPVGSLLLTDLASSVGAGVVLAFGGTATVGLAALGLLTPLRRRYPERGPARAAADATATRRPASAAARASDDQTETTHD